MPVITPIAQRPLTAAPARRPLAAPAPKPPVGPDTPTLVYIGGRAAASAPVVGLGRTLATNVAKQGKAGFQGFPRNAASAVGLTALIATATSLGVNTYRYLRGQIDKDALVTSVASDAVGSAAGAAGALTAAALITGGLTLAGAGPLVLAVGNVFAGAFGYGFGERTFKRTSLYDKAVAGIKQALT